MLFSGIPRIRLLEGPTPLHHLKNVGKLLGNINLYVKRDDVMSLGMGGNKIRMLEFWLGDAISKKSDVILVGGMPQSNQCRLTAVAAAAINMRCIIFHNAEKPEKYNGNILLNKIMETETVFLGNVSEEKRSELIRQYADQLKVQGHKPYIVGDPIIGALGYVNSALELAYQAENMNIDLKHIFICGSMGSTEAGLLYGLSLFGKSFKVHIVSVEYKITYLKKIVQDIFNGLCDKLSIIPSARINDVAEFYQDYLGEGYEKPTAQSVQAIKFLAKNEGIFIENTYNAKVFAGMFDLIKKEIIKSEDAVCCYHTGGTPTLFEQAHFF